MLNYNFNHFAKNKDLNLFPPDLKTEIEEATDKWIYDDILNGVYKCGFAATQEAYDEAFDNLFTSLERCEDMLEGGRLYLFGDTFTYADLRLFMNLIRFDPVYVVHFKCNKKPIENHKNLSRFVRNIYHKEDLKKFINMDHIKRHYYGTHKNINPRLIWPEVHSTGGRLAHLYDGYFWLR